MIPITHHSRKIGEKDRARGRGPTPDARSLVLYHLQVVSHRENPGHSIGPNIG
jgi:hypothetical protein